MPQRRSADSLREVALRFISHNLELTCCGQGVIAALRDNEEELPEVSHLPVTCLPATLLSDLLERIALHHLGQLPSDRIQLPLLCLHLLIQPQIQHHRLLPALPALQATFLIASRCPRLASLDLSFCTVLPSHVLASLVSHLPQLQHLDLSRTQADDLTLASLGANCPRLASLNVHGTIVSQRGLALLSKRSSITGKPSCPALVHLNLLDTAVIPFAVYEVVTNHPLLREVEYESFEEVLRCFTVMNDALGEWDNSSLRRLNFVNCHGGLLETLQHCSKVFPSLDSLSILQSDLTRSCLDSLKYLTSLTCLELGNSSFTQYTVYFHEHVVPLLDQLGNKLTQISLEKFKFVDVEAIGESCPKLQKLRLSRILSFCNTHSPRFPLLNLESLIVLNTKSCRITESTLRSLLTSPRISNLQLTSVAAFTDNFLFTMLQAGRLSCLREASFQHLPGLSAVGISLLLASPSPLASLASWGCPLTDQEREAVVKAASEANLDLSFDWRGRDVAEEELLEELPDLEDMEDLLAQLIH